MMWDLIRINNIMKRKFKQWWSIIPPISTKTKESLNSDGTIPPISTKTKASLNSDGQQFHQYQQKQKKV